MIWLNIALDFCFIALYILTKTPKIQMILMGVFTYLCNAMASYFWYIEFNEYAILLNMAVGLVAIAFYYLSYKEYKKLPQKPQKKRNRIVAGLLALFLGTMGIHKFYTKKNIFGMFYLLFCWTFVPFLISIVEAIRFFVLDKEKFDRLYNQHIEPNIKSDETNNTLNTEKLGEDLIYEKRNIDNISHDEFEEKISFDNINVRGCQIDATGIKSDFVIHVNLNGKDYDFNVKKNEIIYES